LGILTIMD